MQVIVLKSPRLLRGVLRRLFGIRSNTQEEAQVKQSSRRAGPGGSFLLHISRPGRIPCGRSGQGKEHLAWN